MTYRIAPLAIFLLALFLPAPAFAACGGPTGNAGDMMYNSASFGYQYCDGTNWHAMGPTGASGSCTSPTGSNGDLVYNSGSHVFQFCAGKWIAMGPTGSGGSCGGTLTTGLVGWWKLTDGSGTAAADSSGNGATGNLVSAPTWITTGPNGGGLKLNGTNQWISITDESWLDLTGSWTISLWVKPTSNPGAGATYTLFQKDNGDSSTNYELDLDKNGIGTGGLGWIVNYNSTTTNDNRYAEYNTTPVIGTWYFLTGVYNSSAATLTLYLNGASVASFNATGLPPEGFGGAALALGSQQGNSGYSKVSIDDARVYNTALTAAQVAALASSDGQEGDIMYNSSNTVMQYCNGTWVGMGY